MVVGLQRQDGVAVQGIIVGPDDACARDVGARGRIKIRGREPKGVAEVGLGRDMAVERIHFVLVVVGDEPLRARRGHERRQLSRAALQLEAVVDLVVLVAHPQADVGLAKVLHDLGRENVTRLIDIPEGWRDFPTRVHRQRSQVRIAPNR